MIDSREKSRHVRELHAVQHVLVDLAFLKKVDPRNEQLPTFEHAPARNAEQILLALLDVVSKEAIVQNRRAESLEAEVSSNPLVVLGNAVGAVVTGAIDGATDFLKKKAQSNNSKKNPSTQK